MIKRIEIVKSNEGFHVCIIEGKSLVVRRFTYRTIEAARTAAQAWSAAHGNCPVVDLTAVWKS